MSLLLKAARSEPGIEMFPDAWKRFHGAVRMMAKAGPQHRPPAGKKAETGKARTRRTKKPYTRQ